MGQSSLMPPKMPPNSHLLAVIVNIWKSKFFESTSMLNIYGLKGTVLRDRFGKCCRKLTDLGLNKGHGWFLNFKEVPLIFIEIKHLLSGKC